MINFTKNMVINLNENINKVKILKYNKNIFMLNNLSFLTSLMV